ncbi:hypothetical protein IVB18_49510 (plasmid) [Bradyrhizobium sp. 186]|jgi:hypothetical protein|uniref:hypothetical protein n=1 Tax=Bradyrhizobium sp. 186 TaxID=2782654 RepID=UPI0020010D9D|nr:hypothetical protein [Bradyrhizobium sp. 186]UPK40964.1 hypothetical protein IVB18_49510 [Bradyrhizobium sp. 186]
MRPLPVLYVIANLVVVGAAAFGLALVEDFLQRWMPEGVSYRLSDSAPLYALIILLGGFIAAAAGVWGLLHLVGLL